MRAALNHLGFGRCHHMLEVLEDQEQRRLWLELAQGAAPEWEKLFSGFRAAVDWPSAYYWRELSEAYPEAKVLLTVRSSQSWLKSMQNTIFKVLSEDPAEQTIGKILIGRKTFDGRFDDADHVVGVYENHIAEVKKTIPAQRLLVYEIGDGWAPLCQFLGAPVPEIPFPRTNSTAEFNSR